jgi:LemA protein
MSIASFVFLGIFAALFLYAVTMYNNFVRLKNNVAQAWSNIDVLLKQRHDELPKLVEAWQYTTQCVLESHAGAAVHSAREAGDVAAVGAAETSCGRAHESVAVAENYRNCAPTRTFSTCKPHPRSSRRKSPTGVSSTTIRSTPTMSASRRFRTT